jgi:hypothetical protein
MAGASHMELARDPPLERKNAEMGFFHMALIVITPLILTILAVLAISLFSLYEVTAADGSCKREVFRLQHELSALMRELTHLNPLARTLRRKREIAEEQLAAAFASQDPQAIAAAVAIRKAVIVEQEALATKQLSLLTAAKSQREQSRERFMRGFLSVNESASLAVHAQPAGDLTPDYVPDSDFRRRQSQTYLYKVNLSAHWPALFQKLLEPGLIGSLSTTFSTGCSATLSSEENKWKPVLNKVSL